ncbi:retrovirus-related Pol polyprotein from transposon 412 [Trichonephila clavipes]|nr:retrovirus-related Pol polyprotein from transposon 412 [Trichonephila clavipes]
MSEETIPESNEKNKESPDELDDILPLIQPEISESNLIKLSHKDFAKEQMKSSELKTRNPVERMHRTLKRILRVLCLEAIPDWEKILPQALFALRTVRHDSTGFSPAELVHGKLYGLL